MSARSVHPAPSGELYPVADRESAATTRAAVAPVGHPGGAAPWEIANTASALDDFTPSQPDKYELQSYARDVLCCSSDIPHRIYHCHRTQIAPGTDVDVMRSREHGRAYFVGLMTCGSVWACPVCAAKISERRRELLATIVAAARAQGFGVFMATFTHSHTRPQPLSATLAPHLDAHQAMRGSRPYGRFKARFGIIGSAKALEVTWTPQNGWHVHTHVLLFLDAAADPGAVEAALYPLWKGALSRRGLRTARAHGVRVQATEGAIEQYVAKWGKTPEQRPWGVEDELTKLHAKRSYRGFTPFQLLRQLADTDDPLYAALFREFVAEFSGSRRRQLTLTPTRVEKDGTRHPGLAERFGLAVEAEKTDEQLAVEERDQADWFSAITTPEWWAIGRLGRLHRRDYRGLLKRVAEAGDVGAFRSLVEWLVAEFHVARRDGLVIRSATPIPGVVEASASVKPFTAVGGAQRGLTASTRSDRGAHKLSRRKAPKGVSLASAERSLPQGY